MNADTPKTRLNNLSYQAVVKAGGFVNRNNKFILESIQDKGRVFVPEENITTVLYTSKPRHRISTVVIPRLINCKWIH